MILTEDYGSIVENVTLPVTHLFYPTFPEDFGAAARPEALISMSSRKRIGSTHRELFYQFGFVPGTGLQLTRPSANDQPNGLSLIKARLPIANRSQLADFMM